MKALLALSLALPLAACTAEVEAEATTTPAPVEAVMDMTVESGEHTVKCGCSIEAIGECGNYIEIDSQFVEIANGDELGLGSMAWCTSGPAQAEAAGAVKDGKFIGSALTIKE